MYISFILVIAAAWTSVVAGLLGSADEIGCTVFVEKLCENFRELNGIIVGGRLVNGRFVFPQTSIFFHDIKLRINNCEALSAKDPCFSSPCKSYQTCYNHLDNSGYHCGCSFGTYETDCGTQWGIGFVDQQNSRFGLLTLPFFELYMIFIIRGVTPTFDVKLPVAPVYHRFEGGFYFMVDEVLYRGQLLNEFVSIDAIRNLPGYSECPYLPCKIGGGGLAIDTYSKLLYVAHKIEGSIKRYSIPGLDTEEIVFPSTDDVIPLPGISAIAFSNSSGFLFWMDLMGIMRCSLDDCKPSRVYSFAIPIPLFSVDTFQIIIDDTEGGKMLWSERKDPQTLIVKMANQDGTEVESVWEDTLYPYMLTNTGWLVRYERVSRRFLYARIQEYTSVSSSHRSQYKMRWRASPGTHPPRAIYPV